MIVTKRKSVLCFKASPWEVNLPTLHGMLPVGSPRSFYVIPGGRTSKPGHPGGDSTEFRAWIKLVFLSQGVRSFTPH